MESILTSVKKLIGIDAEYTHFDPDIVMYINSAFMTLRQIGVGPDKGFVIEDDTSVWSDFIPEEFETQIEAVKTYVAHKVKLAFDPPQNSAALQALKDIIAEDEWRINVEVESTSESEV